MIGTRRIAIAALAAATFAPAQDTVRAPHDPSVGDAVWWVELAAPRAPDGRIAPGGVLVREDGGDHAAATNPTLPPPGGWSPDRSRRVVVVRRGRERDLEVQPVRAGRLVSADEQAHPTGTVRLTRDHDDLDPFWSLDGTTIYFRSNRGGDGWQLWRIAADGGEPERLTSGEAKVHAARLAPDGARVLLDRATQRPPERRQGMRTYDRDVSILDLATGAVRTLIDDVFTVDFAWSPDGTRVVCGVDADVLFVDATSGATLRRFATAELHTAAYAHGARGFVWRPDQQAVACKLSFLGQTMVVAGEAEPKMFGDDEVCVLHVDGTSTVIRPPTDSALKDAWSGRPVAWRRLPR